MRVIRLLASLPSACLDTALSLFLALCTMHRVDDDELSVLVVLAATLDLMGRLLPLWEPGWNPGTLHAHRWGRVRGRCCSRMAAR